MAKFRTHDEARAQGLIPLTDHEVREHVYLQLEKSSRWDTWALRYGPGFAGAMAILPGFFMVNSIRNYH